MDRSRDIQTKQQRALKGCGSAGRDRLDTPSGIPPVLGLYVGNIFLE
ncbi:hypothetical protein [Paenibacillus sp. 32O-W]|nr:hypothetical protein [Paenibacillus sp. 32O-W]